MAENFITPPPLRPGDTIAVISPASVVKRQYVDGAAAKLRALGFEVRLMPGVNAAPCGSYASTEEQRLDDICDALSSPDIKAILCSRGGYGAVHLLPHIPLSLVRDNPKWLIGFSDISALHALFTLSGVVSLHAPMARHIAEAAPDDIPLRYMLDILQGATSVTYTHPAAPGSVEGEAAGRLVGGNLAVLEGLAATPFDIFDTSDPLILFIEDVGEAIYRTERMLWRLHLSGVLHRVGGIILGQFTETRPDANFPTTEAMIRTRFKQWGIDKVPVAVGFPVGHVPLNLPMPVGARVSLKVADEKSTLTITL